MATDLSQEKAHGEVFGQVLKNISLLFPGCLQMHFPQQYKHCEGHEQSTRNMGAEQVFFKREMSGWNEIRVMEAESRRVTPNRGQHPNKL